MRPQVGQHCFGVFVGFYGSFNCKNIENVLLLFKQSICQDISGIVQSLQVFASSLLCSVFLLKLVYRKRKWLSKGVNTFLNLQIRIL